MCVLGLSFVLRVLSGQEATRSITVRQRGVWDLISALGPAEMTDPVNITPAKPQTSWISTPAKIWLKLLLSPRPKTWHGQRLGILAPCWKWARQSRQSLEVDVLTHCLPQAPKKRSGPNSPSVGMSHSSWCKRLRWSKISTDDETLLICLKPSRFKCFV